MPKTSVKVTSDTPNLPTSWTHDAVDQPEPAPAETLSHDERVRLAAYERFLARADRGDGSPDDALRDWLEAEAQIAMEDAGKP